MASVPDQGAAIYRVLGLLETARPSGSGWQAPCPAHDDRHPSLSIGSGLDGRVLLHCKAGCPPEAVCAALGLTLADLFEHPRQGVTRRRFKLIDQAGRTVAEHVRDDSGSGKAMWFEANGRRTLNGHRKADLPLYGLPELLKTELGARVIVCEGETAAQSLLDRGILAVGTATGASDCPSPDVLRVLTGYSVALWPDNDDAGLQHMQRVAAALQGLSVPVAWVLWPDAPPKGDAADFVGDAAAVAALVVETLPTVAQEVALEVAPCWNIISSQALARLDVPEAKWAVPGIVPEGLMLLAGRAKFGKSWWVLDLCMAIAQGAPAWGRVAVEQGNVLYITFEDSYRRIKDRQARVLGHDNGIPGLDYVTDCPRSNEGGIEAVMAWVKAHPRARLIVIDPLEYWRPLEDAKRQLYRQDYESLAPIVELARGIGISVIVIHHVNKMVNPDNPFDAISGSTGLQGAPDALGVFRQEKGMADAVLFLRGKDVEKAELAFRDQIKDGYPSPPWELIGSGDEYRQGRERFEVLEALWREPWQTPRQLAEVMDPPTTNGAMRKRLFDMAHARLVRVSDGKYAAAMQQDAYLAIHGLSNAQELQNSSNASNAVTPESPTEPITSVTGVTAVTGVTGVTQPEHKTAKPSPDPKARYCQDCGKPTNNPSLSRCYRCRLARGEIIDPQTGQQVRPDGTTVKPGEQIEELPF